ncbi:MAG: GTP cyclohydrolase I, partial [Anaerolineales bacterium]
MALKEYPDFVITKNDNGHKNVFDSRNHSSAEGSKDQTNIEIAVDSILRSIGEDPAREGLLRTPNRVARMFEELTSGYDTDPIELINGAIFTAEDYDEMVVIKDI